VLELLVNNRRSLLRGPAQLESLLTAEGAEHFREIWIVRDAASMCALVAGDVAWLMMLRFDGDAGFSSRNPNYVGPDEATLSFRLSNGQVDEYPVAWTLPKATWLAALQHFAETGGLLPDIEWHDDG
jgi:hypothetical protein